MEIIYDGGRVMSRKEARETAMKLVYQMDINDTKAEETLENHFENNDEHLNSEERTYVADCVAGVAKNLKQIDEVIEKHAKNWKLSRIAKVDLAIMRLAIYEILHREDIPNVVAVDEAIELSKEFGGENSYSFVNGILGNLVREQQ
jgi:transcription antitermination protein NusB